MMTMRKYKPAEEWQYTLKAVQELKKKMVACWKDFEDYIQITHLKEKIINGGLIMNKFEMVGIKDFEMPDGCENCPFIHETNINDKAECMITNSIHYTWEIGMWAGQKPTRMKDCPLITFTKIEPGFDYETNLPDFKQGDEVIWHETDQNSFKAVILDQDELPDEGADPYFVFIFTENGCVEVAEIGSLELTGKHYDNIETLLKFLQMGDHVCNSCLYDKWSEVLEDCICGNEKSEHYHKFTSDLVGCECWKQKGNKNV